MAIVFKCECGRGFKVPDEAAGKKVKCKDCGEAVRVPAAKAAKQKVASSAPADEDDYGMDFGLREDDLPTALPPRKSELQDYEPKKKKAAGSDSAPRRKKKKGGGNTTVIVIVVVALIAVGVGGFFVVQNLNTGPAKPLIVEYKTFSHQRGGFSIEYPSEWKMEASDENNNNAPPWANFEDGPAYISIRGNMGAAAVGDITNSMTGLGGLGVDAEEEEKNALKTLHDYMTDKKFANDFKNYEETPGELVNLAYGPGWLVEFTGSEVFTGKLRGYRLTLKGSGLQQYTVIAKVANNRWDVYQPILEKVVKSIGPAS